MKFLFVFLSLLLKAAQSHKYKTNFLGPSRDTSFVQKSNVERLTKVIREDLNSKVDEVVDLIATDLERELLKGGLTNLSLLEQGVGNNVASKAKEIVKKTLLSVLRSLVPMFERWVHDSVQPPVVDRHVYGALVHPIGFGISEQLHAKLNITEPNPWKMDELEEEEDEEEDLLPEEEEVEDKRPVHNHDEGNHISDEAIDQLLAY